MFTWAEAVNRANIPHRGDALLSTTSISLVCCHNRGQMFVRGASREQEQGVRFGKEAPWLALSELQARLRSRQSQFLQTPFIPFS